MRFPSPLQARVNRSFARLSGVELREAEHPPEAYPSLSEFFVRGLGPGLRSWPDDPDEPGSPADGVVGAHGPIRSGAALQAKGIAYPVADMLGSAEAAEAFTGGLFLTIYLAPRHYHRVHAPLAGRLGVARSIPGRLLPVNPPATSTVPRLLVGNERLVTVLAGERYQVAVVAVGALNVGSISPDFDRSWHAGRWRRENGPRPSRRSKEPVARTYDPPLRLEAGDPLMTFHLGSTVVLLIRGRAGGSAALHPSLVEGREIRLGEPLLTAG